MVNNVDVLESLGPKKLSTIPKVERITSDIESLKYSLNKVEQNMKILAESRQTNSTTQRNSNQQSDRLTLRGIFAKLNYLERRINNFTARLSLDRCSQNPCQNGGTCRTLFDGYRCECPANFEGPLCNNDVNECEKYAGTELGCQNKATCVNKFGSYE